MPWPPSLESGLSRACRLRRHLSTLSRLPVRTSSRIACPPFDSAARVGVQPEAELRHVQGHNHEQHAQRARAPAPSLQSSPVHAVAAAAYAPAATTESSTEATARLLLRGRQASTRRSRWGFPTTRHLARKSGPWAFTRARALQGPSRLTPDAVPSHSGQVPLYRGRQNHLHRASRDAHGLRDHGGRHAQGLVSGGVRALGCRLYAGRTRSV